MNGWRRNVLASGPRRGGSLEAAEGQPMLVLRLTTPWDVGECAGAAVIFGGQ